MKLEAENFVSMVWKPKMQTKQDKIKAELMLDIQKTILELEAAQQQFCELTDADLVDAQIYWMKCLESRYAFLIRRAKEEGLSGEEAVLESIR